ncbi:hypothetical protein M0805_008562 [Coniferiporia weirii]|nr:hypothetical protein M0805_008562 [Coniferiporia weirii]
MSDAGFTLDDLATIVRQDKIFRYTAGQPIKIYDYILTLKDEMRLVWTSRLSVMGCIYCLNRVVTFVSAFLQIYLLFMVKDQSCKEALLALALLETFIYLIGEIALFLRVRAIWNCNRIVSGIFLLAYVPGTVGATYALAITTERATAVTFPGLIGNGCLLEYTNTEFWVCYFILLLHETLMLSLMAAKAFYMSDYSFSRTYRRLIKDGVVYYICVFLLTSGNICVIYLLEGTMRTFLIMTQTMLHSILCARFLLRLRGAYSYTSGVDIWSTHI